MSSNVPRRFVAIIIIIIIIIIIKTC